MDVEHFIPQNESPELKYEWTNLYPASHDANMMKPRTTPHGGYLDPCDPSDDVEQDLLYFLDYEGDSIHFEASTSSDVKAVNTARLLEKLHNGDTQDTYRKTAELRNAIHKKYVKVLERINEWRHAREVKDVQAEFEAERLLKGLLSRKASYTMLLRSTKAARSLPDSFFD